MAVSEQTPYIEYVANGVASTFALGFECSNPEFLIVKKNGVVVDTSTWSLIDNGVVFSEPPSINTKLVFERNSAIERSTNFQTADNSFRPAPLNNNLDYIVYILQEIAARLVREISDRKLSDSQLTQYVKDYVETILSINNPEAITLVVADIVQTVIDGDVKSQQDFNEYLLNYINIKYPSITEFLDVSETAFNNFTSTNQALINNFVSTNQTTINNTVDQAQTDVSQAISSIQPNVDAAIANAGNMIGAANKAALDLITDKPNNQAAMLDNGDIYRFSKPNSSPGAWVFTGFNYIAQAATDATTKANAAEANANALTREKTKNISNIDIGSALFAHIDANDNLVEATGKDGQKYLTGLSGSVQENILINKQEVETVKETLNHINKDEISFAFTDKNDRVVAYLKNDGKLILVDLNKSVQEELNQTKAVLNDLFTSIARTEVKTVKGLVKSNYTVDASTILSMKVDASNSMPYIKMDSPYRKDDFFVHPCVIELTEPMRGYKYLMCITPYYLRNPLEENPTIYGSNDQVTWTMLTGFDQPLDNPPDWDETESGKHGYLSDNWWAYDPINKELYCCYRKGYLVNYPNGYDNNDRMQLLYRKTTNGLQWTAPVMFTPETTLGADGQVAPSLIYDKVNNRWVLFYLKTSDWRIYVRFNAKLEVDGWTTPQEIGYRAFADANGIKGWHIETKFIGDKLFMLIGDSVNGKYYFAKANDDTFLSWTFSANSVLSDTWTAGAYKGSFLEVPQENGNIKLRLYFTDTGAGRLRTALSPEILIL